MTEAKLCSTYDGVAIAYATLSHLAKVGCNTLFVTHYPMVAEELANEVSSTYHSTPGADIALCSTQDISVIGI